MGIHYDYTFLFHPVFLSPYEVYNMLPPETLKISSPSRGPELVRQLFVEGYFLPKTTLTGFIKRYNGNRNNLTKQLTPRFQTEVSQMHESFLVTLV